MYTFKQYIVICAALPWHGINNFAMIQRIWSKIRIALVHSKFKDYVTSPRRHPQSDHIINTHTQNKWKLHIYNSSVQAKHTFDLQKQQFDHVGFQDKFDTTPLKPTKINLAQFQRAQLTNYKTVLCLVCLFPLTFKSGSYVDKPTPCGTKLHTFQLA